MDISKSILEKEDSFFNWLTGLEVQKLLCISNCTLKKYRYKGIIPFSKMGNKFFYKKEDIHSMLESRYHPLDPKQDKIIQP